jgi:hypothetical protein
MKFTNKVIEDPIELFGRNEYEDYDDGEIQLTNTSGMGVGKHSRSFEKSMFKLEDVTNGGGFVACTPIPETLPPITIDTAFNEHMTPSSNYSPTHVQTRQTSSAHPRFTRFQGLTPP